MYIRATASISPQQSFTALDASPAVFTNSRLRCAEPDYAALIDPKMMRRMSRIIKMGVASAMDCLKTAAEKMPGAIITGTAYGCLADTEVFLSKMVEQKEELLTPTAFIQSTHNTVGAQIALLLKCHHYNNTFVNRGFSFESALLDGISLLHEKTLSTVLVGGIDEITDASYALLSRFGLYKKSYLPGEDLFSYKGRGTIAGEGAAFFLLSQESSEQDYAQLKGLHTFYKPAGGDEIEKNIVSFLSGKNITIKDIDLVITGRNGDHKNDTVYNQLSGTLFTENNALSYKHLCGEYPTSGAFALWLACNMIKKGIIPDAVGKVTGAAPPKRILIYNHYQHIHHSLYLVTDVEL